jgi:hypothetical protein
VGARRGQQRPALGGEAKQAHARLALALDRIGEAFGLPGADLDLGLDQLAGDRLPEHGVGGAGLPQLLEAVVERQRVRVEDRELLLDSDREVR